MKILFVIPKNKSLFGDKGMTAHPHIGVAYLCSYLKKQGVGVGIFDDGVEEKSEKIFDVIKEFGPDIIGITIFSYCYGAANQLIKNIKENFKMPLVLGGAHVSAVRKEVLEDTAADFAVKQEGEFTLSELLRGLNSNQSDFSRIGGLIWRKNGGVEENNDRPYINDLDSLPFPDYDTFGINRYACYAQKTLPLITSRGCPFKCNYCSVRLSMGQGFRARSAQNVLEEITHFYKKGWVNFDINDDCFTLNKKRAELICDLIIENNLKIKFQLYNGIRVDTVDISLLKKMKRAGCFFISYGCEAGNDKVLATIQKGITLRQVEDAVKLTNKAGIHNSVNFIVGHKEETYQDALDTLNFADRLPADFVNFYNLLPYPGTESFSWARQYANFLVPPDSFLETISYRDNKPIYETSEFTREQREDVVARGFDLYRKKILKFRLGAFLGSIAYWITRNNLIAKFATDFALHHKFGRLIYIKLSKKSYQTKGDDIICRNISKETG